MKIILIGPPEQHLLMEAGDRIPLGLLYLAGALDRAGHTVVISDLNHDSYYELKAKINELIPEFIGISITTPYFEWASNFVKHLRHNYPAVKFICGGPHPSACPDELVGLFEFIVQGEGEQAVVDIVENKLNSEYCRTKFVRSQTTNVLLRNTANVLKSKKSKIESQIIHYPLLNNIDELAFPAWHLIKTERYGIIQEGERTAPILSSRSCPAKCFFCAKTVMGNRWRAHSVDRIMKELQILHYTYGFQSFYFVDDCFTVDKNRVLEFCSRMKDEKLGSFRITSRTDMIDEDRMIALKDAGLRSISYGLEHMDDQVLKNIWKSNSVENNINAVRLAKKYNIKVRGSFIINLPGATDESVYNTLKFAMDENLDFADFYPLIGFPNTPLWNQPWIFGVKITSKNKNIYQTSGRTNVLIPGMDSKKVKILLNDVNSRWRRFKDTDCPWEISSSVRK